MSAQNMPASISLCFDFFHSFIRANTTSQIMRMRPNVACLPGGWEGVEEAVEGGRFLRAAPRHPHSQHACTGFAFAARLCDIPSWIIFKCLRSKVHDGLIRKDIMLEICPLPKSLIQAQQISTPWQALTVPR